MKLNIKGGPNMDIMMKIKGWAKGLADVGVSLIALGIVLEILFNGQGVPFWPNVSVIGMSRAYSLAFLTKVWSV